MKTLAPTFRDIASRAQTLSRWGAAVFVLAAAVPIVPAQTATPVSLPVIVADFNHDGIPDALITSATTPTATIALGSVPYGTFSATAKAVSFPTGCSTLPQGSVLVGDFNGDGFPDIAFLCSDAAGVMLGNGDGTFGAPQTLGGVGGTAPAVLADFNKDGKLDIAILTHYGDGNTLAIEFFAGNGDGTFAGGVFTGFAQGAAFSVPIVADVNGDGYPDIVMGDFSAASNFSINVFGNNQDGTFGSISDGVSTPSATKNIAASAASSILAGNFFGSGLPGFVVPATGASPGFYVIQNTSSADSYTLADPALVPYAGLTIAMAGNFTNSGYTDLIASNGASLSVLANDGTGNFTAAYTTLTIASTATTFAVGDANGDGYADVYTATTQAGAMQVAVNLTSGSATATSQPFSLGVGTRNVSAAWNGNVNFTGTTASGTQIVVGVPTTTAVTSSKNPSTVGDSITLTAKLTSSIPTDNTPNGMMTITDGTTTIASGAVDGAGTFSYTTSALTQATHAIVATYSGDTYFAGSVSPVLSQVVNHAPAVASNLTWATPAAIVYGTALSATQLNATAVDANGVAIPGAFIYTPAAGAVLDAGTQTLSVTFTPTDLQSFLVATKTVTLTITKAAPVLTWATPASIAYGIPLSATQLNATAAGVTGTALPGTFAYTPASGTVLAPGTQTLTVSFAPTNALDYTTATANVKLVVTSVAVASFTPTTVNLGDPNTKITLTGAGFVATSVVQVNGTAIATTLVSPTSLTAIVPAADFATAGTLQITVFDPTIGVVSAALPLTVVAPPVTATVSAPSTTEPGTQPVITLTLGAAYPVDLTVTLTLGFDASTTPAVNDPTVQFQAGGRSLTFVVPAGTTTVPTIQVQSGTVAGTITVPITLTAAGANVTPSTLQPVTIVVPPAVPTVSGITLTRSGDQLTVVMHGFSNTREVTTATFHFVAAPGASLGTPDLVIPATTIFNDWYSTDASDAYGSTFTYTQIFNTSDVAATIGSVEVTLTNSVGVSTMITAQ